jgi:hypothetical protein
MFRSYKLTDEQVQKILDHCDDMIETCDSPEQIRFYEELEISLFSQLKNSSDVEH